MNSTTAVAEETKGQSIISACRKALSKRDSSGLSAHVIGTIKLPQDGSQSPASPLLALSGKREWRLPQWARKISNELGGELPDWFDHWGKCGDTLICEPYHLSSADIADLIRFAQMYGLDFSVSAVSQHYPTRTVCIRLAEGGGAMSTTTAQTAEGKVQLADVELAGAVTPALKNALCYCPHCSTELVPIRCKLVCPVCRYYLSCSDFY